MINRNRTATLLLLGLAMPAFAQDDDRTAKMQANFEAKMEKTFIKNVAWETDFDKAKAKAAATGKTIFAYFTRSYAP